METHQIIEDYLDTIMGNWIKEVKNELPAAKTHGRSALENDVPTLLKKIAQRIKGDSTEIQHESIEHGRLRAMFDNYSLIHVIREYRILKRVLFRLLDLKGQVKVNERNEILFAIDEAIEQASEVFFQIRNKIEVQAREVAENEASQVKDNENLRKEFIEGLSHDMKNPITNIKLAIDLLKDNISQSQRDDLLNLIHKNVQRTEILLNNLMSSNFINAGDGMPVELRVCNLVEEIESFVNSNKISKISNVRLDISQKSVTGYWDAQAMIRAVDNLLQNALRYGDINLPITIGCHQFEDHTEIFVHNFGKAIAFEEQAKIFSRLYQINRNKGVGQGLGLTVVKDVAEAHGGKVEIKSSEEKGTKFTIIVPNSSSKLNKMHHTPR